MTSSNFLHLSQQILKYHNDVIRIQTELTAIPALGPENGGQGEWEKACYIKNLLEQLNCDSIEQINAPDERVTNGYRPNLIAKIKGESDEKTIWLMSHMDIVPPGDLEQWNTDPYKIMIKDGKLYGRGTEDDNQGIISSLLAVRSFRDLNIKPRYDVGLAIVADEEAGSDYGIKYILKSNPDIFHPNDFIIIPDAGDPLGTMIEVAEKSLLWIKCETTGKQSHASIPEEGINAHKAAAHFIVKMNELYTIFDSCDFLFDPPTSTFEPTKKETNVPNINTIPGNDIIYFDCRILPEYSIKKIQEKIQQWAKMIEQKFNVIIKLSYPQLVQSPPPTPENSPVIVTLKKSINEILGRKAKIKGIGGGTVAVHFRQTGLPAVCWCTVDDTLHGPNEYSRINNILNDARIFAHVFIQE
jgi:succinyl-diaminopimelate desuccinylase